MPSLEIVLLALVALLALLVIYVAFVISGKMATWLLSVYKRGRGVSPQQENLARRFGYACLLVAIAYNAYAAVYPTDDFYLAEFKEVALRDAPSSAKVAIKSSTYPDFHGDYCSFSRIEVSAEDFNLLLSAISQDKRFSAGESISMAKIPPAAPLGSIASFTRQEPGEEDHHLGLKFLSSRMHIEVNLCVT